MARLDRCTKCNHYEATHRQRDVRNYALDECNLSGCFCTKYSSNKKFIGLFTQQGIPKNLSDEEKGWFAFDWRSRPKLELQSIQNIRKVEHEHD